MKLKLEQIWGSQNALEKLAQRELSNMKAAYWLGKNTRHLISEIKNVEKERMELFKKYGKEDPKTHVMNVAPENKEVFQKEMQEMFDREVEVDLVLININDISEAKLAASDCMNIDFMLKDEPKELPKPPIPIR